MFVYIYIYIYMYVYVCIYIYIYIHMSLQETIDASKVVPASKPRRCVLNPNKPRVWHMVFSYSCLPVLLYDVITIPYFVALEYPDP